MIKIFVTGGTFDKDFDEKNGKQFFRDTHMNEILALGRSRVDFGDFPGSYGSPSGSILGCCCVVVFVFFAASFFLWIVVDLLSRNVSRVEAHIYQI